MTGLMPELQTFCLDTLASTPVFKTAWLMADNVLITLLVDASSWQSHHNPGPCLGMQPDCWHLARVGAWVTVLARLNRGCVYCSQQIRCSFPLHQHSLKGLFLSSCRYTFEVYLLKHYNFPSKALSLLLTLIAHKLVR